jgi:ribose-phosphate pyrophosphokinase
MNRPSAHFSKGKGKDKAKAKGRRIQLLSGRVHPELAGEVAKHLGVELADVKIGMFANGEVSLRINESLRGNDVFIIQAHSGSVNRSIMEQLLMIDAAKRASARSITAVCPFLGYARQDRKAGGREPIGARLIIDLLSVAGADRIMSVDLHSGQTQGFFDGPFDHLIAMPLFKRYMRANFDLKNVVMVSPDAGRVKLAERYSASLGCDLAIIHKHRSTTTHNKSEARYLIGDVKGKVCVTVDDMIDTAGTIVTAADLLLSQGAKEIYGLATHGVFSEPALERLEKSAFTKIITTDTLPTAAQGAKTTSKIETLSIAPLIADAIAAIAADESVSALFEGDNQI